MDFQPKQKKERVALNPLNIRFQPKISVTVGLSNHITVIIRAEARCCMSTVVQSHTCIHNVTVHLTYACQSRNPDAFACNYAGSQGTQGNPLFMPVLDCTDMIE